MWLFERNWALNLAILISFIVFKTYSKMDDAGDSIQRGRNRKYFIHSFTYEMKQIMCKCVCSTVLIFRANFLFFDI